MKKTAIVICALISMWTAGPVFASTNSGAATSETTAPIQQSVGSTAAGTDRAADTTATSYAAREKAAPQLANFKGGDSAGIYIGGSTLAVVLLIVLLIVLI
ncbi:MAG: hypothetical protein ABJA82_04200 [Myxococcales bacterium]